MSKKFKYVVTDPCFLISYEIWAEVYDKTKGKSDRDFCNEIVKHLPKGAMVQVTGIRDDVNSIYPVWEEEDVNIVQSSFTSDSGFICIAPVEQTEDYKGDARFAIIESNEELSYEFDTTTYNKTVVEFSYGGNEVAQSEFADF